MAEGACRGSGTPKGALGDEAARTHCTGGTTRASCATRCAATRTSSQGCRACAPARNASRTGSRGSRPAGRDVRASRRSKGRSESEGAPRATGGGMKPYQFKLYVAGESANSVLALQNLRDFCSSLGTESYEIEVVDVLAQPKLGLRAEILVTPTLELAGAGPRRRLVGTLRNTGELRALVGLHFARN
ncbi:MAG: hypothetical protein EOO23_07285 [Comamonadaceae bacterium]|nr:MAG: hypothetical protein EOO23_07285 [Comamonadaceae bacterium]